MTGAGIVLSAEETEVVNFRHKEFADDLRPKGGVARYLTQNLAIISIQMDRCALHESAAASDRMRKAEPDFLAKRVDEANRLYDWMATEPAANIRKLLQTPEGVDRMIKGWEGIKYDLERESTVPWNYCHLREAENLMGRRLDEAPVSRARALSEAIQGNFEYLEADEGAGLEGIKRSRWARKQFGELIDNEIARLEAHKESFDPEEIARDCAESFDRALFDSSKEATLARKYAAAAQRNFFRTLREIRESSAQSLEDAEFADEMGSSFPEPEEDPMPPPPRVRTNPIGRPNDQKGSTPSKKEAASTRKRTTPRLG